MNLPDRHLLMGMTLGAVCASVLAVTGPGAVVSTFADELVQKVVAPGFDTDNLVKFEDRNYIVEREDWVSTDVLSSSRIKKVEAGRVSYVTISTTPTGTYSSDAMFSPHVQYPGISVTPDEDSRRRFAYWTNGKWSAFATIAGNSWIFLSTNR